MQIVVLCTHTFGLPTITGLAQAKLLKGIITLNQRSDVLDKLNAVTEEYKVPMLLVNETKFAQKMALFIRKQKAEVVFVFAFSKLIPAKLLSLPKRGFINFHPGILPQFRGPDPAFWQIKQQLSAGGLTVHQMDAKFDTGPIITIVPIPIQPEMTYNYFLSEAGFAATQVLNMLIQTLQQTGQLPTKMQNQGKAAYQNRPSNQDLRINWTTDSPQTIRALVNACNTKYGGAHTLFRRMPLQILAVTPLSGTTTAKIGEIIALNPTEGMIVACKDGKTIGIDIIQSAEGIMTASRFANMALVKKGELFS